MNFLKIFIFLVSSIFPVPDPAISPSEWLSWPEHFPATPLSFLVMLASQEELVLAMSFTLVTMSTTRDWVLDILTIDDKNGDVRLRDGWEKMVPDTGGSESPHANKKGKSILVLLEYQWPSG